MAKFSKRILHGALAALVCLLTPAAGHAALIGTFDPIENSTIDYDYTVPTNGKTYRWIFNVFSADPNASVYLTPPTQVEGFLISPTAADFNYTFTSALSYIFHETVQPGQTTILVKGPKDYNNCNGGSPIGQTCGAFYNVWGNGTFLQLSATSPVTISFSALAAPEPEIWAMMIVGMAMIGAAKRKQVARRYAAKLAGSD